LFLRRVVWRIAENGGHNIGPPPRFFGTLKILLMCVSRIINVRFFPRLSQLFFPQPATVTYIQRRKAETFQGWRFHCWREREREKKWTLSVQLKKVLCVKRNSASLNCGGATSDHVMNPNCLFKFLLILPNCSATRTVEQILIFCWKNAS
jgi:hypothetical protein